MINDGTKDKTTFAATDNGTLLTISYRKATVTITKPTDTDDTTFEDVPGDPTALQPGHVAYIPGYTPQIDGKNLTPDDPTDLTQGYTIPVPADPTTPTTVNYDPNEQTVHVNLVDTKGNPVKNDNGESSYTFHGVTGEGIHVWRVDKQAAAYIIADDGTLKQFVYDNDDSTDQVVNVVYLKQIETQDPDRGITTLLTDGDGKIVSIDKQWGTGVETTGLLHENDEGTTNLTLTPDTGETPLILQPGDSNGNDIVTGTILPGTDGDDFGNIILTQKIPEGVITETITPNGQISFSQVKVPSGVSVTSKDYFTTQVTHDPDHGTTTTKTDGDGNITAIDRDWPDGDHSHVEIDLGTHAVTFTETPKDGRPDAPVTVAPGASGQAGKTTLNNGEPDGSIELSHQQTPAGEKTTVTITPDTQRTYTHTQMPTPLSISAKDYYTTQVTRDPDGGKTTTKTNGDGDITTIDKDWGDGDHSHVDINTDTGIATITETPNGGEAGTPVEVQPGESGKNGKTTLDNGEPDGSIVLTHQETDRDKTTETITPDTSRSFSRQPGGVSTTSKDYFETQITHDPDGGTTTTKTNGDGDITTIDKDWGDGDHSHVDIDTDTGIAKITETPAGDSPSEPIEVQPGESGKNGKTTLDNGEPGGNIVLTHQGTDGDKTTETITPDTSRSFSRQPGGVSTTSKDYFETQVTHDPDGGTTITKTNGDGDITTINKDWSDGDHSHVDIDTDTEIATITETPKGGNPSEPIEIQPGESGKNGKTTLDNGEPDGNIVLTHQDTDGDKTTETITPDTSRSFSRQPGGVSTDASHYFETQITHDPDGGTTTTKTNGDGDITTIDKDWGDGDHSHVDIDTDTGITKITETPKGGSPSEPVTVQPGESGKNGKTTLDNGEPDGNIVLTANCKNKLATPWHDTVR